MAQTTIEELHAKYLELHHGMQSSTAQRMSIQDSQVASGVIYPTQPGHSPKMLRTGVNSALVETGTIVNLLIEKGILTTEEWFEALNKTMQQEVTTLEKELSVHFGLPVKLL